MADKSFEEYLDLIQQIHTKVNAIEQELKGYDGNPGLCKQVSNNIKATSRNRIMIVILATSTGGGIFGLVQALT